jgi:hypothetical protein
MKDEGHRPIEAPTGYDITFIVGIKRGEGTYYLQEIRVKIDGQAMSNVSLEANFIKEHTWLSLNVLLYLPE